MLFITPAYANAAAPAGIDFMQFLPMIGIFILFWFLLVRPQQKKVKEHKAMLEALQKMMKLSPKPVLWVVSSSWKNKMSAWKSPLTSPFKCAVTRLG